MATTTDRNRCAICNKEKATLRCGGCSKDFCFSHVADHRQELSKQLDEVEVTRDIFRQTLTEQSSQPQKHPLVQQIDQWELESINKIRQTAEEARQRLLQYTTGHVTEIEVQLNKLTDQLRQCRQEDDFFETDLSRWTKELARLMDALNKSPNINVRQDSVPFVKKLVVDVQNKCYTRTARNLPPNNTDGFQNSIVVGGQEPLTPAGLANATPQEQKQMLGERLFPLIQNMQPDLAGKITGMLLEIDNTELLHMLESRESLKTRVEEAIAVLQAHQAKQIFASKQAATKSATAQKK